MGGRQPAHLGQHLLVDAGLRHATDLPTAENGAGYLHNDEQARAQLAELRNTGR